MILIKLSALGTDGSRVMLWFDDGSKMRVPTSLVADLGLYRGMELGEDDLSRLMEETVLSGSFPPPASRKSH